MRDDPVFTRAIELWRPRCNERRDAFARALSFANSEAVKRGSFGESGHGEVAGRAAGEELELRAKLMVEALEQAHRENGGYLTGAHNSDSFRLWAHGQFKEEVANLKGRFSFNPPKSGERQYRQYLAQAEERERAKMANTIIKYFEFDLSVRRSTWGLTLRDQLKDIAARVASYFIKPS